MLETLREALPLVTVVTLVAVIANVIVAFLSRQDVKRILKQAEKRVDLLREEQQRLTFLHEERRLLVEQLREAHQEHLDPQRSQQHSETPRQDHAIAGGSNEGT